MNSWKGDVFVAGKMVGRLLLIGKAKSQKACNRSSRERWHCRCSCGKTAIITVAGLAGDTKSCGCLRDEAARARHFKHGEAPGRNGKQATREYRAWRAMMDRCYLPGWRGYKNHGGRGITVCDRWRHSYLNFLEDMRRCPSALTLERIDNDGNYEPDNCKWATRKDQIANRRPLKLTPEDVLKIRELKGQMLQREIGQLFGVTASLISMIHRGRIHKKHQVEQ